MSLAKLCKTDLPLNRKERFFTGTVFPMIVCRDDFRDLSLLARLIPGCQLPPVNPDPQSTNLEFFTEYSLVESIYGPETKKRFPTPPSTKDTPDVIILIKGPETVLLAIEAKMYHQPQLASLAKQIKAQRVQLEYLRECLGIDRIYHAALLPEGYAKKIGDAVPMGDDDPCPVFTWDSLLETYRGARGSADYFMGMLELALDKWDELASVPNSYGSNAEAKLSGEDIVSQFRAGGKYFTMGRDGGLKGPKLAEDVASGEWRTREYEVTSKTEPPNKNWFLVKDFVQLIDLP